MGNIYLGRIFDRNVLHFEYERCSSCSLPNDRGGTLVREKYPWREPGFLPWYGISGLPVYDEKSKDIIYISVVAGEFKNDEEYTKRLDQLFFLRCSRFPECKFVVNVMNSVILKDSLLLINAQHAYRKK